MGPYDLWMRSRGNRRLLLAEAAPQVTQGALVLALRTLLHPRRSARVSLVSAVAF